MDYYATQNVSPVVLSCRALTKTYGGDTPALDRIDLTLTRGHIIGLLGPNGSGKTTLLKLIAGLLTPTSGEAVISGLPTGTDSKRLISYLPDQTYLSPSMRITDALSLFSDFYTNFDCARAYDMLQRLSIDPSRRMKELSKGSREKVQLILVMSRRADLYLLDEPIAGVDPAARDYILHTIVNNFDPRATVLISTHLIMDVEPILDEVIFLSQGHVLLHQPVSVICEKEGKSIDQLFREVYHYAW